MKREDYAFLDHEIARQKVSWTSFGKFHDEPAQTRLICELSDSHLLHIIEWIKDDNHGSYCNSILRLMIAESAYRCKNYIFVKEYEQ
jgi:hypothetical protein